MIAVGSAAAIVAAFLPWVSLGPFTVTGIDGDGQITLGIGVVVSVMWFVKFREFQAGKVASWIVVACGALVMAVGVYHFENLGSRGTVGIGIYATVAAGVLIIIGGIEALRTRGVVASFDVMPPPAALPPAGWHPDPTDNSSLRYWDGSRWTEHVARPE